MKRCSSQSGPGLIAQQTAGLAPTQRELGGSILEALFHLLDVFRRGNALGRGAANAFDGGAHLLADLLVGLDRLRLLLHTFARYLVRSYCSENAHVSWCPSPGCEVIVEYKGGGAHDIVCRCGHKFCFRCKEEAHRPANCDDVRKWHLKNTSESENVNWMIANTKVSEG